MILRGYNIYLSKNKSKFVSNAKVLLKIEFLIFLNNSMF